MIKSYVKFCKSCISTVPQHEDAALAFYDFQVEQFAVFSLKPVSDITLTDFLSRLENITDNELFFHILLVNTHIGWKDNYIIDRYISNLANAGVSTDLVLTVCNNRIYMPGQADGTDPEIFGKKEFTALLRTCAVNLYHANNYTDHTYELNIE